MQKTDVLLNSLIGPDPILGRQALDELRQLNASAWPNLFESAVKAQDKTYHGRDRLAKLCAHFGAEAAEFLVSQIETGNWGEKGLAADCLRYVRDTNIINDVAKLAEHSQVFDVQRHAIAALGEAGADGWARTIYETIFGKDEDRIFDPSPYTVEKLAHYGATALAQMVVKETNESDVSHRLFWLDKFLKRIWNDGKIKEIYSPGEGEIKRSIINGLHEITPTSATPLMREWLNSDWTLEQAIAAEAFYYLPLDRVATELGKCLLDDKRDAEVRYECAISLMGFSTFHASRCLRSALPLYSNSDHQVARGIMWAYSGLFFYEPPAKRDNALLSAILAAGGEPKAQLIYGYGIWQEHPELIEDGLGDPEAFTRADSALALARSKGASAISKLRNLWRDASTPLERLFANAALVHAGDEDARKTLHAELCHLPFDFRDVRRLRHIWKREIISALNSDAPPWTPEAIAWAEVMEVDIQRCMEQAAEIAMLSPSPIGKGLGANQPTALAKATAVATQKTGPVIFVSYSHEDEEWLRKIERVLSPLIKGQDMDLWTDKKIDPGAKWKQKIEEALARADLALLLVSQPFLASDFISKHELPPLLKRAEERGVQILWIPVSDSLYTSTEIAAYQAVIDPKRPLDSFRGANLNKKLVEVAKVIAVAVQKVSKAQAS